MIKNFIQAEGSQFYACGTSGSREVKVQVGDAQKEGQIAMSLSEAEDFMDLLAQAIDHARREVKCEDVKTPQGFCV